MHKAKANQMSRVSAEGMSCTSCAYRRRRRRNLSVAVATAAVLASSTMCSAFSSNRLACHSSVEVSGFIDYGARLPQTDDSLRPRRPSRPLQMYADEYGPRRPSRPLQMVSFLETEMVTDDARVRAASRSRLRASNSSSGRKIELESSDEVSFDFDYFVTTGRLDKPKSPQVSTNRRKSAQVSTSEPKIKKQHDSSANFKAAVKASSEKVSAASAIDSEVLFSRINKASTLELETDLGTNATIEKPAIATNSTNSLPRSNSTSTKSKNKSSTMPGFIRDEGLDDYVAVKTTKMLSPRRKVSRMVRSKSARKNKRQINSESLYRKSPSVPDSLLDYAQEIHAISRVTPKEEIELGTKTQEAIRLQKMFDDLYSKYGREPTNDEWCAAAGKINMQALEEALQAGNDAKNQLVASNLRMVQRVVNLYIRNGLGSEYNAGDLMQDGTMALIRAAEKYEPERGFRFSTYAMYWIRSAVKRSQTVQSRIVNVPQRIHETYKRVTKMEEVLKSELGRPPTDSELADSCEISVMQLGRCRRAISQAALSLDAEIQNSKKPNKGSTRRDTMYDVVVSKVDETEYETTQRILMKEHLISTLKRYLTPHEVDLLLLRYGLMDERALPKGMSGPLTIAEVSKLVGLKPDKVRRIIINSQKQLRHLMKEWEDFEYEAA